MDPAAQIAAQIDHESLDEAALARLLEQIEPQVLGSHGQGTAEPLLPLLERLCERWPQSAHARWLLGLSLHDTQQHERALLAMQQAAALLASPATLLGQAQLCYETGRPAAAQFAALCRQAPEDPRLVRNLAGALAAEGQPRAAEQVLQQALDRQPGWLEGQRLIATLRQTSGWPDFDAGYASAVQRQPGNAGLRLGWFSELAKARRWDAARRVIAQALRDLGEQPGLLAASLYLAAESGAADLRPDLFDALAASKDPGIGLARVRHALRTGRPEIAARDAEAFLATPSASMFWPYLSIAWRLLGDARADWLDRPEQFIRAAHLELDAGLLEELATLLRSLHTTAAPYLEQSVRGGTQTDRPLLFRHEPAIARLRSAILDAVRDYVDALPAPEAGHPLLAPGRTRLRFAGSWSVRLHDQGFHSCHTHPAGWISSACYIALPPDMGTPPAGWLRLGTPPKELKLDLPPYREIAPEPGLLVMFPSTMWHGTAPFRGGERLTVAFDMRPID